MKLRMVLPIQIAVIALLAGAYFGYLAVRGSDDPDPSADSAPKASPSATQSVATTPIVSERGGFGIGVPEGVVVEKSGKTVTLSSVNKAFVVIAGPADAGSVSATRKSLVGTLKKTYTKVRVISTEKRQVDGREALATYGEAVNAKKVPIAFVSVVVKARPQNFAINSYVGLDANPSVALPRVSAMLDTFTVLK